MTRVWSIWVRAFHWSLAIGFVAQFFNDSSGKIHEWLGYALAGLIFARVIYGLKTSNPHERWEEFKVSPSKFWTSLKSVLTHKMKRQLSHPPQASFVMAGILIFIVLTVLSGHLMEIYFFFGEDWAGATHEWLAWISVALIAAHILGVFHASWAWKENLTASMIHGKRRNLDPKA